MNGRECVKQIMEDTAVANAELAGRIGITQAALWDRLNNTKKKTDIAVSLMTEMLRALDYKVVVIPRSSRIPTGGYELE